MSSAVLRILFLTVWSALRVVQGFNGAVVLAPNAFRIGVEETVFLQLSQLTQDTNVTLSLHSPPPQNEEYVKKTVLVKKDEPLLTTLTLPATGLQLLTDVKNYRSGIESAQKRVTAILKATSRGKVYFKTPLVRVALNTGPVFLQLDRPIYSPGQKVKLRIIVTDNFLKSTGETILLEFVNPHNLIVYREKYGANFKDSGILKIEYNLGTDPILGRWTICVRTGHEFFISTNETFEVRNYVLPTFDAHIEFTQKYILPETIVVEGKVIARHTFGDSVDGTVGLRVTLLPPRAGEPQKLGDEIEGTLLNGEFRFNLNLAELRKTTSSQYLRSWFPGIVGSRLKMLAYVTESGTESREIASHDSTLFVRSPYVVRFDRSLPDFKAGYSYSVVVDVLQPNGDPAIGVPVAISDVIMGTLGKQLLPPGQVTDHRGVATFTIAVPFKTEELSITVVTQDPKYSKEANAKNTLKVYSHRPMTGPGVGYVWLQPKDSIVDVRIGSILAVDASVHNPNNAPISMFYLVVAHGRVISWGTPTVGQKTYLWVMNVEVKPEMSPFFRIIVYTIQHPPNQKGYFLADSIRVQVENKCPYNRNEQLTLNLNKDSYAPKNPGHLTIVGENSSYVGVMAVDQALYVLRKGSILTRSKLFSEWEKKTDIGHGPGGGRTVGDVLKNAGLVALFPGDQLIDYPEVALGSSRRKRETNDLEDDEPEDFFAEITANDGRTDFQETWLYEDFQIGDDTCPLSKDGRSCKLTINAFPDSITRWNFQALAVSPTSGLCVAETIVTTVKSLFVQLKLPYLAVRTETLELVATVFNHGGEPQKVLLYIDGVEGLCSEAKPGQRGKVHRLTIPQNGAASHRFVVIPMRVGEFDVTVTARSLFGADAVIKRLKVVAEGNRKSISSSQLLDPTNKLRVRTTLPDIQEFGNVFLTYPNEKRASVSWEVIPPEDALPETSNSKVSITGSILGPILETALREVESFFQNAAGSGEQSLMKIAPTLYSALYLKHAQRLPTAMEDKARSSLVQGYSFSLQYRKPNGGMSIWVQANYLPNVWLTSYYMRVFCEMRQFVPAAQNSVIESGLDWLASQQMSNGAFNGTIIGITQVEMPGGMQGTDALTAFTLTSFVACHDLTNKVPNVVSNARNYLEGRLDEIKDKPYALALVTYALALTNSTVATMANQYLEKLATEDAAGNRYWMYDDAEIQAHHGAKPWVYVNKPHALNVEITAYALLAQVALDRMTYAGPIVAWLANQRSAKGTFVATQDTTVTLEALAAYGRKSKEFEDGMTEVDVFIDDVLLNEEPLIFDKNTGHLTKEFEIPVSSRVRVEARGLFPVLATVQIKYNSLDKSEENDAYIIEADVRDIRKQSVRRDQPQHIKEVYTCIEYCLNKKSGMVIVRFGIPTGFEVDQTHIRQLRDNRALKIGNVKMRDSSVIFYFNEIPSSPKRVCFSVRVKQTDIVQDLQPTPIEVTTYYETNEVGRYFYRIDPEDGDPTNGKCKSEICHCQKESCPPHVDERLHSELNSIGIDVRMNVTCDNHKYAYIVEIQSVDNTELQQKMIGKVIQVIRAVPEKKEDVILQQREFYMLSKCDPLEVNSFYLIVGKKKEVVKSIKNANSIRYILDGTGLVWNFPAQFLSGIDTHSPLHDVVQHLGSSTCHD